MDLPEEFDWPTRTREWWQAWRDSPQAKGFAAVDWEFLLDTALVHADFWGGNTSVAGELRARLTRLGVLTDTAESGVSFLDELERRRADRESAASAS